MNPGDIAFLKAAFTAVFLAGGGLIFYALRVGHRSRIRAAMDSEVEALREENAEQRAAFEARLVELEERVDFVERRLTQGREPQRIEPPVSTPV